MPDFAMSQAIRAAYQRGEEEETMEPLVRVDSQGQPVGRMGQGHYVIFYNLRGEREVELTQTLTDPQFAAFDTGGMTVNMATMIEYHSSLPTRVAFPPLAEITGTLGETVSQAGLRQARVAESEKGIHITYFFDGKRETPYPGTRQVIIESSREVEDFDELPQMHVAEVAAATIEQLQDPATDLIIANFANMDVVGHIADRQAVCQAIAAVDEQVGAVVAAARKAGVVGLITADHGSVEKWYYPDGQIDTGHTDSPVPLVLVGLPNTLRDGGDLTDVAPTILQLLNLSPPAAMTGRSLLGNPLPPGQRHRVLLLIVDGWGLADDPANSLLEQVPTPHLQALLQGTVTSLQAAGEVVGMPAGTVGNSEAGHLHLGAGRVIPSDRLRIEQALSDGSYHQNPAFLWAMQQAKKQQVPLHLMGIISFFSSHGSVRHLIELLKACARQQVPEVCIHGLLGRRGEQPESGAAYIQDVEEACQLLGVGQVVSVIGRHWALDREERWDRVEKAYRMLVDGHGTAVLE